jgi:hypothetical protein
MNNRTKGKQRIIEDDEEEGPGFDHFEIESGWEQKRERKKM